MCSPSLSSRTLKRYFYIVIFPGRREGRQSIVFCAGTPLTVLVSDCNACVCISGSRHISQYSNHQQSACPDNVQLSRDYLDFNEYVNISSFSSSATILALRIPIAKVVRTCKIKYNII